jgi:hypothetical protein
MNKIKKFNEYSNIASMVDCFMHSLYQISEKNSISDDIYNKHKDSIISKFNIELKDFDDCIIKSPTNYINLENSLVNYEPYEYIKQDIDGDIANGLFINFDIETK